MPTPWQNRIVGHSDRDPRELKANPLNYRTHPLSQAEGLRAVLDEVGLVQGVIVNRTTGRLIDGHLRVDAAIGNGEATVPVTEVELTEAEERLVLATFDPLGAMAGVDAEILGSLLGEVANEDEAIAGILATLEAVEGEADLVEPEGAPSEEDIDEREFFDGDGRPGLPAPFPWFGGKSRVASLVWSRFGDVPNYVEPFAGSLAVILGRPHEPRTETVNDKDGFICNVWRSIALRPEETAAACDWPANENDLTARHAWLVTQREDLTARLEGDHGFCDPKVAGWWLWGIASWIGTGWCSGRGPWVQRDGKLVHLGGEQGVNRQLVHLGGEQGVNRQLEDGCSTAEWFAALSARLRRVRVCCGDWERVCGHSPTDANGLTAVFLDPPYDLKERDEGCYAIDESGLAARVRAWALEHGGNPMLRIAICGYEGEHEMPGWTCVRWKAQGGYSGQGDQRGRVNAGRERVWFSPACLPAGARDTLTS